MKYDILNILFVNHNTILLSKSLNLSDIFMHPYKIEILKCEIFFSFYISSETEWRFMVASSIYTLNTTIKPYKSEVIAIHNNVSNVLKYWYDVYEVIKSCSPFKRSSKDCNIFCYDELNSTKLVCCCDILVWVFCLQIQVMHDTHLKTNCEHIQNHIVSGTTINICV